MSDRPLAGAIAAISLAGVAIAGYLTYVHYAGVEPVCTSGGACQQVQSSEYAELAGVPVALLGLLGYAALLASALVRADAGKLGGAVAGLTGFGFSGYLTYRELFTIDAICQWCVASAILMTALAVLTVWRLMRVDPPAAGLTP